ncbi:hypothetical protein D3C72_2149910 [compost metagenome]
MRFGNRTAHVAATLGDVVVEREQQKVVDATQDTDRQNDGEQPQQPLGCFGVGQ